MSAVAECDGRCCAVFVLSMPVFDIGPHVNDGEQIKGMVRLLDVADAYARCEQFGLDPDDVHVDALTEGAGQLATCEHWREDTHDCAIYEQRPGMCSRYPHSDACQWCGGVLA